MNWTTKFASDPNAPSGVYMLRDYLKHNTLFRQTFAPLLRLRASLATRHHRRAHAIYQRCVIDGIVVVSPSNLNGQFAVNATSHLAARSIIDGQYENEITDLLKTFAETNKVVVNVGANVGFYAIHIARTFPKCPQVIAIEPNPEAFELLCQNILRNDCADKIQAVQKCIGDSNGKVQFAVIAGKPEYSSLRTIVHPSTASCRQSAIEIPIARLTDVVGESRVGLLLVDTEGAEGLIFNGARDILDRDKPTLLFECSDMLLRQHGTSSAAIEALLREHGYVARNALAPSLSLRHPFEGEVVAMHASVDRLE